MLFFWHLLAINVGEKQFDSLHVEFFVVRSHGQKSSCISLIVFNCHKYSGTNKSASIFLENFLVLKKVQGFCFQFFRKFFTKFEKKSLASCILYHNFCKYVLKVNKCWKNIKQVLDEYSLPNFWVTIFQKRKL